MDKFSGVSFAASNNFFVALYVAAQEHGFAIVDLGYSTSCYK
jgi:hypothetical protein